MAVTVTANPGNFTLSAATPSVDVEFGVLKSGGQSANKFYLQVRVQQGANWVTISQTRDYPLMEGTAYPISRTLTKAGLLQYFNAASTNSLTIRAVAVMKYGSQVTGEEGYVDITANLAVPPIITSFTTR